MKKKYKVFVKGQSFSLEKNGKSKNYGFYTTRFVEADNNSQAVQITTDLIRAELLNSIPKDQSVNHSIYIEEITELTSFEDVSIPGTGFSWYPQEKNVDGT